MTRPYHGSLKPSVMLLSVTLVGLVFQSCVHTASQFSSSKGKLEELHETSFPWGAEGTVFGEQSRSEEPLDAISLEMTSCYGTCPAFTVLYCRDGSAWFCGYEHVDRIGCFKGQVGEDALMSMTLAVEEIGFFELAHTYAKFSTDQPSTLVYVRRGAESKIVRDYGDTGPRRLFLLSHFLDRIAQRIDWSPTSETRIDLSCSRKDSSNSN